MEAPAHGSVAVTGITYGDVATYSCDKSFEISGVINRQCLSDGQWSAAEPICVLKGTSLLSILPYTCSNIAPDKRG